MLSVIIVILPLTKRNWTEEWLRRGVGRSSRDPNVFVFAQLPLNNTVGTATSSCSLEAPFPLSPRTEVVPNGCQLSCPPSWKLLTWLCFKAGGHYKIFGSRIENLRLITEEGKIETFAWVSHLMKSHLFIYWNVTYHGNCPPSSFVGLLTWGESSPRNKRKSQLVQPYFSRWLEHPSKSGWSRQRTQLCPRAETLSWPVGSRTR